jgi:cytidine deaminase
MKAKQVPTQTIERLRELARVASEHAYCPYSRFRVGAAVLSDRGEIFTGCNVENASYGLTICAERNAIFRMVAERHTIIRAVAIYTPTATATAPCGACRQVIHEFGPGAEVISFCDGPYQVHMTLADLLPGAFGPSDLK